MSEPAYVSLEAIVSGGLSVFIHKIKGQRSDVKILFAMSVLVNLNGITSHPPIGKTGQFKGLKAILITHFFKCRARIYEKNSLFLRKSWPKIY